ncbi:MAG: 23S rRNA (pseudouridine(1915)-N(3))-methyltransferase RlmH [Sandaracinaceae bacterium]|nr:23S rRNA (pseudouridine(1915)-N(3))-methyltransferase RlmH [Sandaracinaceae bacterium]
MRVSIIAVGKIKERGVRDAIDDYVGRIKRYAKIEEVELKDGDEAEVIARFEKAIAERTKVVALEVDGQAWSTERFARYIGDAELHSVQSLAFLIGGSYGLPPALSKKADLRLSLSAMTLPHRLARLLLAEQIYRAFTVLRGEPYSH